MHSCVTTHTYVPMQCYLSVHVLYWCADRLVLRYACVKDKAHFITARIHSTATYSYSDVMYAYLGVHSLQHRWKYAME